MMNWRIGTAIAILAGAPCGFQAFAQQAAPAQQQIDANAEATLKSSAAAIQKLQAVSYKSKLYGLGGLKEMMDGEGEVIQFRNPTQPGRKAPMWSKGSVKDINKGKLPFTVSSDGTITEWIDDTQNLHLKRPATDRKEAQPIQSFGNQLLLLELNEPEPFTKQLKAQKIETKPNEQIRGTDCNVIVVSWENGLRSETWWIGAQDQLPRKMQNAYGDLGRGIEIWDLKVLDSADVSMLALKTPPGYKEDFQTAITPPTPPRPPTPPANQPVPPPPLVGLAPGIAAPDFDLKSNGGSNVKLSGVKGNVTVITFGGSRFPKSDAVNSLVSEVVSANKDKNVQAFALACREESDQAAIEHAAKTNVGFPVLLGADAVRNDYKVTGFPFTYVLTADGRISRGFQGPMTKAQLESAVAAAIKGEVAEIPKTPEPVATPTPGQVAPLPGKQPPSGPVSPK